MGRLTWIVVGLLAGWLASQVMRSGRYGRVGTIIVGTVGAVIGGFLAGSFLNLSRMKFAISNRHHKGDEHESSTE